ncbi:hypothetical protein DL240_15270 [Lujinxingia litoralis]|uniref:Peptidase M56 domain-containing protein n=1 Tax=Lujinxingia litoralis TaxID=2211119 RepID=A0A328C5T1_9DELT|nr:hypothetical protein [Lujinxingia litoralis]RAL20676.1 hypothetical protein DL240_15270 [Lujinxingia litoralis]
MPELLFPIAALTLTFGVLIPALTLISRRVLARRRRTLSWTEFGSNTTYAWLVAPTLLPLIWLLSSALHQAEPSSSPRICLHDHGASTICADNAMLLGALLIGLSAWIVRVIWQAWPRHTLDRLPATDPRIGRIQRLIAREPGLQAMRVVVVRDAEEPLFTQGFLRPQVVLDRSFMDDADDAMLHAALLHEAAHIRWRDTLRYLLSRVCLGLNPAGALLRADRDHWRAAREALCDSEAVHMGGQPLALAQGLVRAARFRRDTATLNSAAMLCGHHLASLKLRLAILMQGPTRPGRSPGYAVLALGILAVLVLPHLESFDLLHAFHMGVERLYPPSR